MTFRWPRSEAGQPNNVVAAGQVVAVTAPPGATRLGFLGMANHGPSTGQGTIRYTDGSTQPYTLGFSDWTGSGGVLAPGTRVVVVMPYRNSPGGETNDVETSVFAALVPIDGCKTVAAVALPTEVDHGDLHVFALALGQ